MSTYSKRELSILSVFLLGICALMVGDVLQDLTSGTSFYHVINETIIVILNLICFMYLWSRYFKTQKENVQIKYNLSKVQADLESYKQETQHLSKGLSEKIDKQFEKWSLSKSEKDVAFLILKGLSTKEMATVRQSSESTIKQQCNAIYQKSNLSGRSELSAFFLEDLFVI